MIPREVQMAIQEASSVGMTIKETKAKLREMNLPVPDSKSIRKYYNKKETADSGLSPVRNVRRRAHHQSDRGLAPPSTPPYVPFGIRRFISFHKLSDTG